MKKQNCWEFKSCGRHPDGAKAKELGVCPAATEHRTTGVNDGHKGGRACWAIAGTLCGGTVQGSFASKVSNCMKCDFYRLVGQEEGVNHKGTTQIMSLMR